MPDFEASLMAQTANISRATSREWIGLAVIALPCVLYSMDLTVLNLAVPQLSADLKPSGSQLLWIMDIYGFLIAGFLITMGTLGDRIGRRKLLLIGAAAFGVASVLAAFANSTPMLIAARAVLGIAGATLAPSTLSLIRNMFHDPSQRTFAIGVWATSFSVGGAIGPVLGGVLLEYYWWGSVFLLAVPVMVLLLIVGPILLPEFRDPRAGRLDLSSVALSLATVLTVIYGFKRIAENGVDWAPMLFILAGLAIGFVFVRRQRLLADPMIDLKLFRQPAFSASLATNLLSIFAAFASFLYIAQYLQLVLGLSPLQAGLWLLPSSGGFIVGSMTAPIIVRHIRPAFVIGGALVLAAVGFALLAQVNGVSGLGLIVTGSVIMALGIAPAVTLTTDLIVGTAPPERAGVASGMSETSAEFGGALGIAVLGSVGTAVYRSMMDRAVPEGLSSAMTEAAMRTLGGAAAAAERLPESVGTVLLSAAREAFAHAMQASSFISAIVLLVTAIIAAFLLRSTRTGGGAGAHAELGEGARTEDAPDAIAAPRNPAASPASP